MKIGLKTFFVLLSALLMAAVIFLITTNSADNRLNLVTTVENRIYIENMLLTKSLPDGYVAITSDSAYIDISSMSVVTAQSEIKFSDKHTEFAASADSGQLLINKTLQLWGNVFGKYNELNFSVEKAGTFTYDFNSKTAEFKENVILKTKEGTAHAQKLYIDYEKQIVKFDGAVKFIYKGGS